MGISITGVHPVQVRGEQRRFIPAGRAADFDDYVLVVIRVLRQQQDADFLLQLGLARGQVLDLHFDHFFHFIIKLFGLHHLGCLKLFHYIFIFSIGLKGRLQIGLFFGIVPQFLTVACNIRVTKQFTEFLIAVRQGLQSVQQGNSPLLIQFQIQYGKL
ncbi:hypothetical protein D3C86_1750560 [compost metagenome]